jgi:hypothetical protein
MDRPRGESVWLRGRTWCRWASVRRLSCREFSSPASRTLRSHSCGVARGEDDKRIRCMVRRLEAEADTLTSRSRGHQPVLWSAAHWPVQGLYAAPSHSNSRSRAAVCMQHQASHTHIDDVDELLLLASDALHKGEEPAAGVVAPLDLARLVGVHRRGRRRGRRVEQLPGVSQRVREPRGRSPSRVRHYVREQARRPHQVAASSGTRKVYVPHHPHNAFSIPHDKSHEQTCCFLYPGIEALKNAPGLP